MTTVFQSDEVPKVPEYQTLTLGWVLVCYLVQLGEFIITAENMKIPAEPKLIYSINEGNYRTWDEPMQRAIDDFRMNKPAYTARYVGSMVADVHRTLVYGGIYLYPADAAKVSHRACCLFLV